MHSALTNRRAALVGSRFRVLDGRDGFPYLPLMMGEYLTIPVRPLAMAPTAEGLWACQTLAVRRWLAREGVSPAALLVYLATVRPESLMRARVLMLDWEHLRDHTRPSLRAFVSLPDGRAAEVLLTSPTKKGGPDAA